MKSKLILFVISCLITVSAYSQSSLNDYKYVIVPESYSFLKEANKYRLNDLTKFLFNKYGFNAILANESYPEDLAKNPCLALKSNVIKESGFLKTKLKVKLENCNGISVFETKIGETREKEYDKAYNLALRDAFTSFEGINYKYVAKENTDIVNSQNTNISEEKAKEIQRLKEEVEALKKEKEKQATEVKKISKEKSEEVPKELIVQQPTETIENVLYAQPIPNGYQLVDSSPKVVMILLETGRKNNFLVKDQNATVYKEDGLWYLSKNENGKVITKTLNIKF